MKRNLLIGLGIVGGVAGALALGRRLTAGGGETAPGEVQWPFDRAELRTLMDRVVEDQRATVGRIEDAEERARAQAFLEYYEGRRAAV